MGAPPAETPPATPNAAAAPTNKPAKSEALDENLKSQNYANQSRQIERLQQRYAAPAAPAGVQVQGVK